MMMKTDIKIIIKAIPAGRSIALIFSYNPFLKKIKKARRSTPPTTDRKAPNWNPNGK